MSASDKPVLDGELRDLARERIERTVGKSFTTKNPTAFEEAIDCLVRHWAENPDEAPTKPLPEAGREGLPWVDAKLVKQATESAIGFWKSCERPDLAEIDKVKGALIKYQMALDAASALKAASPQSSEEEGEPAERAKAYLYDLLIECDVDDMDCPVRRAYNALVKKPATQGGREAVHRAMNERDKHWIFALGAFRQLPADEVQAVLARLPALGSFTTPRSEEDIRKAAVEECKAVVAQELDLVVGAGHFLHKRMADALAALHFPADREGRA